jgi:hypothetical protein
MVRHIRNAIVLMLCATLGSTGCATARTPRVNSAPSVDQDSARRVLVEYAQSLPRGADVRVSRAHGRSLRGTLMKATDESVVIQPRTRLPEPAVEIPFNDVLEVTPEHHGGSSVAKAIGIGAAAGAAAMLTVLLVMFAVYGD